MNTVVKNPNSFIPYARFAHRITQFGFISTSTFCSLLIYLTVFWLQRSFGSYKYLLIIFPSIGILFATVELILYPDLYSHNAGYLFYTPFRPFNLDRDMVTVLLSFYTGIYACTISMLSVQFLYRYWAVFDTTKLRYFKGWRFSICVLYSSVFGVLWALGLYYFDQMDEYSQQYMEKDLLERYDLTFSEISSLALVVYNADGSLRWFNISCTFNMIAIMLFQYTVILYCAIWMYHGMEEKLRSLSSSTRKLHKQLFKTLVLQIVTPTISLFSPAVFIICLTFFDLKIDLPTGLSLCAFTIYPAMDAMIVMYVVADYKKAAKRILKKIVEKVYNWLDGSDDDDTTKEIKANIPAALKAL
ncbi:hypothetical protein B9Z55_020395 [Caenorhabditis nigoni]|uniref:Seven TM Receptor n=2 Tax=Caenorhabditis nigoni TaxID=1611254 RepID=A0A2G5TML3_9PELO|nr:hypothetical protein B9Z55_020395 [Caenorhabditis nigoni]